MIIGYIGNRNSGKTLTMTIDAYKKYKEGFKIYSNYHLNFPHYLVTVDDLLNYAETGKYFGNTVFLIDEIHIWFDSRCSGKKRNRIFSYFLNQSSKNDIDVYYTSQFSRQVEIRMRMNTERVVKSSCKCIVYRTKNSKPIVLRNYRPKPSDYYVKTFVINEIFDFDTEKVIYRKFIGNPYFKLYNTREVIKLSTDKYEQE